MSNYFISDGSERMKENKNLIWHFPEFTVDVPVRVGKIEKACLKANLEYGINLRKGVFDFMKGKAPVAEK